MITGISWFAVVYIFLMGFVIGILTSGFIITDWLYYKVKKIEDWFADRKAKKLTEKEKEIFEGIQNKYIKEIKRWDIK